jgi:hypothetical protein
MLEALVGGLAERLTEHFTTADPGDRSTRHLRVLLLLVGFGSLVGLLLLAARQLLHVYAPETGARRVFPDIDVPERLGAPYGGGHIACRSFAPDGR